jgi:hypothetical protein
MHDPRVGELVGPMPRLFAGSETIPGWGHHESATMMGERYGMIIVTRTVNLRGKPCEITVYQRSKSVWFAVGDYLGERLEVKGSSASTAAKRWSEAATYQENRNCI